MLPNDGISANWWVISFVFAIVSFVVLIFLDRRKDVKIKRIERRKRITNREHEEFKIFLKEQNKSSDASELQKLLERTEDELEDIKYSSLINYLKPFMQFVVPTFTLLIGTFNYLIKGPVSKYDFILSRRQKIDVLRKELKEYIFSLSENRGE